MKAAAAQNRNIADIKSSAVWCIRYQWQRKTVLALHNFSHKPQTVNLRENHPLQAVLSSAGIDIKDGKGDIIFPAYGFAWFRF